MNCCQLLWNAIKVHHKALIIIAIPLLYLPIFVIVNITETRCMYVVAVMFTYWMSECVPLPVTSLIPMFMFPLMGIMDSPNVAIAYLKETNMLFLGGLIVALALEESGVHNRIALGVIIMGGSNPRTICFCLSSVTVFISWWISNTAALAMMMPIIDGCLKELEAQGVSPMYDNYETVSPEGGEPIKTPEEDLKPSNLTMCYYITCCYAATIGGLATIIATGTNLVIKGVYETYFPKGPGITFAAWMALHIPILIVANLLTYVWLQIYYMGLFRPKSKAAEAVKTPGPEFLQGLRDKKKALGGWTFKEICVITLFLSVILLWFFREPQFIRGWPTLITQHKVKDGATAMMIAFWFFILPASTSFIHMFSKNDALRPKKASPGLLTWKTIHTKMPWGIVIMLGGAFALADGIIQSGTGALLAQQMMGLQNFNRQTIQLITSLITVLITEFAANVAVANILVPIVAEIAIQTRVHPAYLCIPVGAFASFSFCLPVGTPPNAMVKAVCNFPTSQMIMGGLPVKAITFVVYISMFNLYAHFLYGNFDVYPTNWRSGGIPSKICYDTPQ